MVRIADNAARLFDNEVASADLQRRSQPMPVESVPVPFDDGILMNVNLPLDFTEDHPSTGSDQADVSDYVHPAADDAAPLQYDHIRWFDPAEGVWISTEPA